MRAARSIRSSSSCSSSPSTGASGLPREARSGCVSSRPYEPRGLREHLVLREPLVLEEPLLKPRTQTASSARGRRRTSMRSRASSSSAIAAWMYPPLRPACSLTPAMHRCSHPDPILRQRGRVQARARAGDTVGASAPSISLIRSRACSNSFGFSAHIRLPAPGRRDFSYQNFAHRCNLYVNADY
eukprot:SAG11_NODE_8211_length_1046_cov_1.465681_1_plen_184_part_10